MVHDPQFLIQVQIGELLIDLVRLEAVTEDLAVADFVNLLHHFGFIAANVVDVLSCLPSLLGSVFIGRLHNKHVSIE